MKKSKLILISFILVLFSQIYFSYGIEATGEEEQDSEIVEESESDEEVEEDGITSEEDKDESDQDSEPETEKKAEEDDGSSASEGEESDSESEENESSEEEDHSRSSEEEEDESDAEEEDAANNSPEEEGDQESEEPSESSDGEEQEQKDAEEQEEEVHIFSQDNAVEEVDIKSVNEDLERLGFIDWGGEIPSEFNGESEEALKAFQDYYELDESGKPDDETLNKIDQVLNTPYQSGDRGKPVVELKERLVELGFVNWSNPSQFYGSNTADVVRDFQEAYNLSVDGVMGSESLSVLEEVNEEDAPYHNGDQGEHVVEFKEKLVDLGFVQWSSPSKYYGDNTAGVVRDFQDYYGLTVTGQANEATRAKVDAVVNPPYQNGDRGQAIVEFKENLVEMGFVNWSSPSQFYGDNTADVVKDFQDYYGFEVNGIAGKEELGKMEEVATAPYQNGDRGQAIVEFKENLVEMGFVNWSSPSQFYGDNTADVVRDFQDYYGFEVNGIAGKEELGKMEEVVTPPYQNGDRGQAVVEFKESLVDLGFVNWSSPSKFYGDNTADVVRDFQRAYNLSVDGIMGPETLEQLKAIMNGSANYHIGDSGDHIVELKKDLTALGFANWSDPTPNYGPITSGVVESFQEENGLPASGIADYQTRESINDKVVKVFLDPGHGAKDPGATYYNLEEKEVVLDISLKIQSILNDEYYGVRTNISRNDDTFIELEDRAKIANNWGADYFISVHSNYFDGSGRASGFESFIYDGNISLETKSKQREIHSYIMNHLDVNDRGMKTYDFNVLRNTSMPAILMEYLFIDNKEENELLKSESFRSYLADITAEAIADSYNLNKR